MKNDRNDMTTATALSDAALDRERGNGLDMRALATTRYDEADKCLDVLEFVTCGLAVMDSTYSNTVVNGCVSTIDDAVATLRGYANDAREALISAEAIVRENATNPHAGSNSGSVGHGEHLPSEDLEGAVVLLIGVARATSNQMRFMASAGESYGDTLVSLAANLENAVADVESALDRSVSDEG